jgi:hypothetical protein
MREPDLVGEQSDGDLRLQSALLGKSAFPEPVTLVGLEIHGLSRLRWSRRLAHWTGRRNTFTIGS